MISAYFLKRLSAEDVTLFTTITNESLSVDEQIKAQHAILIKYSEEEYNYLIWVAGQEYKHDLYDIKT